MRLRLPWALEGFEALLPHLPQSAALAPPSTREELMALLVALPDTANQGGSLGTVCR